MLRAMSSYVYISQRLHPGRLDEFARGGAQAIEIFAARGHFDYSDRAHIRELGNWFKSNTVEFHSMDEIKRALEVAEQIPFRFLVQHIGLSNEAEDSRKFEAALGSIEHLRAFARPLGVTLLLENIPNELSTPEKLMELLKTLHYDDLGICFDTGHAHLMSSVHQAFRVLEGRIRSTHVHDNHRDRDTHLWPGEGNIDWNQTMQSLSSAPQAPPLLMEIEGAEGTDVTARMSEAYKLLEQAAVAAE